MEFQISKGSSCARNAWEVAFSYTWLSSRQSFCHAAKGMSCRLFCIDIYNLLPAGPSMQISPADQPAVLQSSWYRRLCLKANQTFKKGANPNPNPNPELFKRVGSTSKPKNMSNQPPRKIFQLTSEKNCFTFSFLVQKAQVNDHATSF